MKPVSGTESRPFIGRLFGVLPGAAGSRGPEPPFPGLTRDEISELHQHVIDTAVLLERAMDGEPAHQMRFDHALRQYAKAEDRFQRALWGMEAKE